MQLINFVIFVHNTAFYAISILEEADHSVLNAKFIFNSLLLLSIQYIANKSVEMTLWYVIPVIMILESLILGAVLIVKFSLDLYAISVVIIQVYVHMQHLYK